MLPIDDAVLTQAHSTALKVARERVRSLVDADAIAQQALLELLQQPELPTDVDSWVVTVTRNLIDEHYRAEAHRQGTEVEQPSGLRGRDEVVEFLRAGGATVAPAVADHIYARLVASLSERESELLLMLADGCTAAQIATDLGYPDAESVVATVHKIRGMAIAIAGALDATDEPHDRM